jgi:cephalosporin-C deacetylase
MPLYDVPIDKLYSYCPPLTKEPDFDAFWSQTLEDASKIPLEVTSTPIDYPVCNAQIFDLRYTGWGGARIGAWYIRPDGEGHFPAIVCYHGYSLHRGYPHIFFPWILQGYAVLSVESRDHGVSTDTMKYSSGHTTGWMTKGILNPKEYFFRASYVDCIRALDVLEAFPEIDMSRVAVHGFSQGGGLSLVVAALDHRPALAMSDMPFLSHFERATDMAIRGPYLEIADFIRHFPIHEQTVFRNLSYFDNMNLASRVLCPTLLSAGLVDDICPPSSVFAAYNRLECVKDIKVFRYHNHEDIPAHWRTKFTWANKYLKDS